MRRNWQIMLLLAAVTLAVYWPVRHHAFTGFDDPNYLTSNPHVQAGFTAAGLKWAFFNLHGENSYWHPLTWVSHMLDCQLFGLNPGPHHLVNVGIHIVNALLLLVVLHRMTGAFWRSAMVAALFALHPLQVDTVAWAAERKNVLSTTFWLLTMWAYSRYAAERPRTTDHGLRTADHAPSFYVLSLTFFTLGLMCKPALVTLPFVLLLLDYWPLNRNAECGMRSAECENSPSAIPHSALRTPHLVDKLPFLALAGIASFMTIAAHEELGADWSSHLPFAWRVNNAFVSYVRYLGKAFWPTHLAVYYPHPGAWPLAAVISSVLVLAAVSAWVLWRARRAPYLVTGWLWFLGVLVPMIGIIQAGGQAMADRFAYVPLIGLFIMVVWTMGDWLDSKRAKSPVDGQSPVVGSQSSAVRRPWSVVGSPWSVVSAMLVLGSCTWLTARQVSYWQNTTTLFEHAVKVTRPNACAHCMLGSALLEQGRVDEAMQKWETALQIEPWWANIHGRIAMILCERGDFPGAIARYRKALEIDPNQYEVLNNLAWLLATCPDASLRNGTEAVVLAERACQVTHFHRAILVGTLAAAYAEAGQFLEAVAMAQKACDLAADSGDEALLARNRELLELYRSGKAYHE